MTGAPRFAGAALAIAVVLTLAACGARTMKTPSAADDAETEAKRTNVAAQQFVVGHVLGSIGERTIGPFMTRSADGKAGMVAWITGAEGNARRVVALPVTSVGESRSGPRTLANVGIDATMLIVRATRGTSPGFAVTWTVLTDRGESLWSIVLNEDGVPRAKPVELARTTDDIVWVDVLGTEAGAVCVWAEETRSGEANVMSAGLDQDGKVRGVPTRVARSVAGWHALEVPGGVGLSTMTSASAGSPTAAARPVEPVPPGPSPAAAAAAAARAAAALADSRGGTLAYQRLDGEGHPAGEPVAVVTTPHVSGDVEVVREAGRLVFAWTDRTTEDPSVAATALKDDGSVEPIRKLVEARGGASLLGLASGRAGLAILYEAPSRRSSEARHVFAARVGPSLALEGRSRPIEVLGRTTPELAATDTGFAVLALQRDCDPGSPRCPDSGVVASVVRTDGKLVPVQREALGFGTDPASMAWGLSCQGEVCLALAASGAAPSRIRAAEVRARVNLKAPADVVVASREGPHVDDVRAVATGENVVDLAVARVGDRSILATLSLTSSPGTKARNVVDDARNATLVLSTRVLDASGVASAPVVLTNRALAVGGVAMAAGDKPEDGAAIVWVARDGGDPEVHVTKIDKNGKKTKELQLTTSKGEASDVAIAWAGAGWVVAWVDGRDGNGEVYATRVGRDLARGTGERITNAPGDASDLVALAVGERVWLAWADPRDNPRDGMADVYVSAVNSKDAKPALAEQRLLATGAHSRTPQLTASSAEGVHVAWIEEAPLGVESPASSGYGAMWVTLAPDGKRTSRPLKLPLGGEGAAASVALERHAAGMRAVVARSMNDAIVLDAIDLSTAEPQAFPLLTLDGPPSLDVALVIEGGAVYFNDDGPSPADKRARRARIAWSR